MKKIALSLFLISVFSAYVFYRRFGIDNIIYVDSIKRERQPVVVSPSLPSPSNTSVPTPEISLRPIPTSPLPQASSSGQYRDGQYIGRVADAYYGNVQVKAFIQNGKISDVQFLQYPSDRRTSIEINTQAMPYLKSEAIQAQSANVDIVSGATATSGAFQESLASALSKAIN